MRLIDLKMGALLMGLLLAPTLSVPVSAQGRTIIAFGSCVHQDRPQPIWQAVLADEPDMFVFLGDNIYGDSEDPAVLQSKYEQLGAVEGFQRLREQADVVAIWDDHDYGVNDGGIEYPSKEASRQVMLDFWNEPADSERRSRPDGIYTAYEYGEAGQKVQLKFSRIDDAGLPFALVEMTSSGLTEEWHAISPNRHRVGEAFAVTNYRLMEVDWSGDLPVLDMSIRDDNGVTLIRQTVSF